VSNLTTQVISVKTDGSIKGLQFKGKGIDLRDFGHAAIKRATDIEWCETEQKWKIKFLQGRLRNRYADRFLCAFLAQGRDDTAVDGGEGLLLFNDYDSAVATEVELIQAAVKGGKDFYVFD
jgi:hypothetical protein